MKKILPHITELLKNLPKTPGVYEMKNSEGETLYVGKAKNLKSRVKSYFLESANHSARISKLIEKVENIEWTQTGSEVEALLLESNLIKEKNPKFNILLRDDKNFSYLRVSVQEDFPRITLVRRVIKDGAKYFGPKTSSSSVRKTIDLLQEIFHFRSTALDITEIFEGENKDGNTVEVKSGNQKYPCLNYHLKKCDAPCIGNISKKNYREKISQALDFLKGNTKPIEKILQEKMIGYAKDGKFELAAKQRDKMLAVQSISEKQIISSPDEFSADIIGIYENFGHIFFHLFSAREGKIINSETFFVRVENECTPPKSPSKRGTIFPSERLDLSPPLRGGLGGSCITESLFSFLRSHPERIADSPKSIVLDEKFFPKDQKNIWEEFFAEKFGHRTEISLPQKAKRKKLLELAHQNAENYAKRHVASFLKNKDNSEEILEILQKKLQMKNLPKRIECYDISHFGGQKTVASMVVMQDGKTKNSDYRSFNIKHLAKGEIDDFGSLKEAVSRRLERLPEIFPESWGVKVMKNFSPTPPKSPSKRGTIFPSERLDLSPPLRGGLGGSQNIFSSEIFFDNKNKLQKKVETKFFVFSTGEKKKTGYKISEKTDNKMIFCIKIHLLTERTEIFLPNISDAKTQRFIIENLRKKIKGKHTDIFVGESWKEELENVGFNVITSDRFLSGVEGLGDGGDEIQKFRIENFKFKKKSDSFTKIPDLIVIDGGKGQLSSVWEVLKNSEYAEKISLCSLAKREEEVYVMKNTQDSTPPQPPSKRGELAPIIKNSPEGHLLQKIRDEAHRFAIGKNRTGREKEAMKSVLDEIRGLGPKTKKILKKNFGGVAGIRKASDEDLLEVVSEKILGELRRKL